MAFKSYKNKLVDFGIEVGTFQNEKGEEIKYKSTVIRIDIDGEVEDIKLSGKNAIVPKFLELSLKSAKNQTEEGNLLDD